MKPTIKAAVCAALLCGGAMLPSQAAAEKVRIADANPFMLVQSYHLYVPMALGWWSKDGIELEIFNNPGSAGAIQSLVGGAADLAMANSGPALSAVAKGAADLKLAFNFVSTSWRLITPKTSAINAVADLKGKNVGVIAVGGGSTAYLESLLRKNGLDPRTDVTIIAIGVGPQAFQALSSGAVDAYIDYRSDIVQLETMGGEYKVFYDEEWLSFPDYGLVAGAAYASANADTLVAIAKGMAMANVFAKENSECVAKIYQKNHGAGGTPRPIEVDKKFVEGFLDDVLVAYENNGSGLYGYVNEQNLAKAIDFLVENKVIEKTIDAASLRIAIPDFEKKVNDFSVDEVKAAARECAGF